MEVVYALATKTRNDMNGMECLNIGIWNTSSLGVFGEKNGWSELLAAAVK